MAERKTLILETALQIATESGVDAVSMRTVASRIGLTAMALYPQVPSKDAMLDGIVDRLIARVALPPRAAPWEERLAELARSFRKVARTHPSVVSLLFTRPAVTPDAMRLVETIYQALLDAGVPDAEVPRLERLISTAIVGFVVSEAEGRFGPGSATPRARRAPLPQAQFPAHHRLASRLDALPDVSAEFDADVADLIEMVRRAGRAKKATRHPTESGRRRRQPR
jgi:AcrR family transcriptional regulator